MIPKANRIQPFLLYYIMCNQRSTSFRFATSIKSISKPMPMYSAQIMKFSDGLRRVIIS